MLFQYAVDRLNAGGCLRAPKRTPGPPEVWRGAFYGVSGGLWLYWAASGLGAPVLASKGLYFATVWASMPSCFATA
jgi:hypothetical protein